MRASFGSKYDWMLCVFVAAPGGRSLMLTKSVEVGFPPIPGIGIQDPAFEDPVQPEAASFDPESNWFWVTMPRIKVASDIEMRAQADLLVTAGWEAKPDEV